MCGIVGFWNRDGKLAEEGALKPMMDRIRHRGPDDSGTWAGGSVILGHLRLSILDLSPRGHQPFLTPDGMGVLSYNGEVYNYQELRQELEQEGVRFTSTSDTEVVLHALHRWGPTAAVPRFNGMFGFAYFDRRQNVLWLGRDRLGIKPVYYTSCGREVVFGSEIKALLAHPSVVKKPDLRVLAMNVINGRLEGCWTPFEGMRSLRPGTICKITADAIEEKQYFDVFNALDPERILRAEHDPLQGMAMQFDQAFSESVRIHLASDAPLATMCSGGLDSSLVTAVAKQHKPSLIAAYVADVRGATSEGPRAKLVGEHLGVEIRQIDFDLEDNLRLWPWAIWYSDQLNGHAHDTAFLAVAKACHKDGIKVLLTGEGSDELFGGYDQQREAQRMWRVRRLRHRLTPNVGPFQKLSRTMPEIFPLNLEAMKMYPFEPDSRRMERLLLESCVLDSDCHLRGGWLFEKLAAIEPLESRAFLARSLEHLYGHLLSLLHRNDRMGMGASIETRVPFLENRLIDLGMHLPLKAKHHKGVEKWVVKEAGKSRLPRDTVQARKMGFQFNQRFFLPAVGILDGGVIADLLGWSEFSRKSLIQRIKGSSTAAFRMVGLELWARLFLRGESPDELGEKLIQISRVDSVAAGPGPYC